MSNAKAGGARDKLTAIANPAMPVKRPRIQDVAALASVSLGTVSAVLNSNGRIAELTRTRVQAAIEKLGYRPDHYASNMARKKTQVLGVIVSNLQNPFFAETAQAMEDEAETRGFQISLMASNFRPAQLREAVKRLLGARLAGLAVLTSEDDEISRQLVLASGLPSVFLDVGEPAGKLSILRVDSKGGMRQAVTHLIELGHQRFLFIKNSQAQSGVRLLSHHLRDQGFASAIRAFKGRGVETRTIDVEGPAADAGFEAILRAYESERYSAVICITDMVAMGAYHGLSAKGLRIPKDVSVVGFDDAYFSRFLSPPLTTVNVSRSRLSQLTVEALVDGAAGTLLRVNTELIVRKSTARPKS